MNFFIIIGQGIPTSLFCLLLFLSTQPDQAEMAVGRGKVKAGDDFTYDNIPGKLLVMRQTSVHKEPQYLWAGQNNGEWGWWTTDGKNQIGQAKLDWSTGKMTIRNFTADDVGSYSFPLEEQREHLAKTLLMLEMDDEN